MRGDSGEWRVSVCCTATARQNFDSSVLDTNKSKLAISTAPPGDTRSILSGTHQEQDYPKHRRIKVPTYA